MWRLLEFIALAALVLISITEFFYPLLAGKPFFGSFRRLKGSEEKPVTEGPLHKKVNEAKQKVEEIKDVQKEVDKHYKSAEQLKEESDQLLSKTKEKKNPGDWFDPN